MKSSGISRFHFTFSPSSKTTVFTATLQECTSNPEREFVRRRTQGPLRIDEYHGPLNDTVARTFFNASDVLKVEAGPSTYRVYYLQGPLIKLKARTPEIFNRQRVAGKKRRK